MQPVQLLDEDGVFHPSPQWPVEITDDLCRRLYRHMALARSLDNEAVALQRQGELGLWLQSLGQEAAQVGSITALREDDYVFPSYREQAAALVRGITPEELLVQWRGNQHSGWDPAKYRFHIYTLVLAAQLLHATGYAMGVQRDGTDEVVMACFGDGSASEGEANEALNWAAACAAPILFFCQNNQFAISTPTEVQMRAPIHQRAAGFGLESHLIDGNDVLAVHAVTSAVAAQIRRGSGPVLLEAVTYRMGGHSTSDDPGRYRGTSDVDEWVRRDPIARLEKFMRAEQLADRAFFDEVGEQAAALSAETRRVCQAMAPGDVADLFGHVLSSETAPLKAEREAYEALLASYE